MGQHARALASLPNAACGDPAYDVADTWLLFSVGDVPGGPAGRLVAALGRRLFLRRFLRAFDRTAVRTDIRAAIPAAVEHRLADRNMSDGERARMRRMAAWAAG